MSIKNVGVALIALASSSVLALGVFAQGRGQVNVVSWGGVFQDAQRKAIFEPFAKSTGVRVVEGVGPQIERSRAEVASGKPGFDMTATNEAFFRIGLEQNLWMPIDYSKFDAETLKQLPASTRHKFGVASLIDTDVIAFNTKAFEGKSQPSGYKDFWNMGNFAGKRALPWCDVGTTALPEAALLADGVPVDKLYPLDIPRAVKKLKELAPSVIWWRDFAQVGQLIANGEASMGMAPNGRIQVLIDGGAPLKIDWNQTRYTYNIWYVLKGAPNAENAMRLIAYASRADVQAQMAKLSGYAPSNPAALPLLDEATARKMATYPDNAKHIFRKDEGWWKENRAKWVDACKAGLM
ncbi:MAG: ABC transporter substrate-binding protein [Proteobacteria bacterium]|nr:ABC transporter substrate-binding protein [Pseudomonadota bacterium]